ncbi:MAG: tetratricopeptide repeat protein, partial [Proteobacteria bacterium]
MLKLRCAGFFAVSFLTSLILQSSFAVAAGPEFSTNVRELTQKGKNADAIEYLKKLIASNDKNADADEKALAPFSLAVLYYNTGDYEKSVATFNQVFKEKSVLQEYGYFYQGMAYFKMGKLEEAHRNFKKVDELNPNAKLKV